MFATATAVIWSDVNFDTMTLTVNFLATTLGVAIAMLAGLWLNFQLPPAYRTRLVDARRRRLLGGDPAGRRRPCRGWACGSNLRPAGGRGMQRSRGRRGTWQSRQAPR